MRKHLFVLGSSLFSIAFIIIVIGSYVIVAQTPVTGSWRGDASASKEGKIHLSFSRNSAKGSDHQYGSDFSFSDLKGLSREQASNGTVKFSLDREAGSIECEGSFSNGKGAGTFRFNPAPGYLSAMASRGFDFQKTENMHGDSIDSRLFAAATINVTTALADDLKSVGFSKIDVDDLFKAAIFKVDSKFMAEMTGTGFPNLTMEDLVKARIFKIDANYVRQINDMGFAEKSFEDLVKFRIFKVTPEFLNELKAEGLSNLSSEDVVKCRIFNIDVDLIRKAKAEDPNVSVEDLVQMRLGVHRTRARK